MKIFRMCARMRVGWSRICGALGGAGYAGSLVFTRLLVCANCDVIMRVYTCAGEEIFGRDDMGIDRSLSTMRNGRSN